MPDGINVTPSGPLQAMPSLNVIDPRVAGPNWGQNVGQDIAQGSETLGQGIGTYLSPQARLARATLGTQVQSANAANQLSTQKSLDALSLHQQQLDTESAALDAVKAKNNLQKLTDQGAAQADVVDAQIAAAKADNKARAAAADFQTSQLQQNQAQQQQIATLMQQNPGMTAQTAINLVVHGNPAGMTGASAPPAAPAAQGPLSGAIPLVGTPTGQAPTPAQGALSGAQPLTTGTPPPLASATSIGAPSLPLAAATLGTPSTATANTGSLAGAAPIGGGFGLPQQPGGFSVQQVAQSLGYPAGVNPTPAEIQDRMRQIAAFNTPAGQQAYQKEQADVALAQGKTREQDATSLLKTTQAEDAAAGKPWRGQPDDWKWSGGMTDKGEPVYVNSKTGDSKVISGTSIYSKAAPAIDAKNWATTLANGVRAGIDPAQYINPDTGDIDKEAYTTAYSKLPQTVTQNGRTFVRDKDGTLKAVSQGTGVTPFLKVNPDGTLDTGGNTTAGAPGQLTPAQTAAGVFGQ